MQSLQSCHLGTSHALSVAEVLLQVQVLQVLDIVDDTVEDQDIQDDGNY